jgi:hypothetical protein
MSSAGGDLSEWLRLALPMGAGALIYWILGTRGSRRRERLVVDDPQEPYRVYTRAFDRMLAARDVPAVLDGYSLDGLETRAMRDPALWAEEIAASRAILAEYLRKTLSNCGRQSQTSSRRRRKIGQSASWSINRDRCVATVSATPRP